jgi:hypothetical protein
MRRKLGALVVCGALTAATVVGSAASSSAAAKPRVRLAFASAQVDAGAPVAVRYSATRVPPRTKVVLQKAVGTAGRFQDVRKIAAGAGRSVTVTAPAMGRHVYRVAVRERRSGKVLKAATGVLYSYGPVPFEKFSGWSETATLNNGTLFRYTFVGTYSEDGDERMTFDRTSCRSIEVSIAHRQTARDTNTLPGGVTVVQENADPVTLSAGPNATAGGTVALAGGAWLLQMSVPSGVIFGNGTASCWSADGTW